MNLNSQALKQISIYKVKKNNKDDVFEEELDKTIKSDVIKQFSTKIANDNFERVDKRSALFEGLHNNVADYIKDILNDESDLKIDNKIQEDNFKIYTREIAKLLFGLISAKKSSGNVLSALYEEVDFYYFLILKVDEREYITTQNYINWIEQHGLDKETKLHKASYIKIKKNSK